MSAHRRHHLVNGRVRLDREQPRNVDTSRNADLGEVVAGEVHDHQVLGAVLLAVEQVLP